MDSNKYAKVNNLINLYELLQNGLEGKSSKSLISFFKKESDEDRLKDLLFRVNTLIVHALDLELSKPSNLYAGISPIKVSSRDIKERLGITKEV